MTSFIFPMAGLGSRVRRLGKFKPAITIHGLTIFEWNLLGISDLLSEGDSVHIVRKRPEQNDLFFSRSEAFLFELNKHVSLHQKLVGFLPRGPVDSVYQVMDRIQTSEEVVVINPDQIVRFDRPLNRSWDLFAPGFIHSSSGHSRIETSSYDNTKIVGMSEKGERTCIASCGVYGFKFASEMNRMLQTTLEASEDNEVYFSNVFNSFAKSHEARLTGTSMKIDLGTEENITNFANFASRIKSSLADSI